MIITKYIEIDMGHRVPNHKSKCSNLHGHRYKINVAVNDKVINTKGTSDEGMVIDFGDLKRIMMEELDAKFDHGFVMYKEDAFHETFLILQSLGQKIIFVPFIPTAENLSKHFFNILEPKLRERGISIHYVELFETPTSTAIYTIIDKKHGE